MGLEKAIASGEEHQRKIPSRYIKRVGEAMKRLNKYKTKKQIQKAEGK